MPPILLRLRLLRLGQDSVSTIMWLFLQLPSRFSSPLLAGKSYRFVYLHLRGVAILENTCAHSVQTHTYIRGVCGCHGLREQEQLHRAQKEPQTAAAATAAVTALVSSRDRGPPARRTIATTTPCHRHRRRRRQASSAAAPGSKSGEQPSAQPVH